MAHKASYDTMDTYYLLLSILLHERTTSQAEVIVNAGSYNVVHPKKHNPILTVVYDTSNSVHGVYRPRNIHLWARHWYHGTYILYNISIASIIIPITITPLPLPYYYCYYSYSTILPYSLSVIAGIPLNTIFKFPNMLIILIYFLIPYI